MEFFIAWYSGNEYEMVRLPRTAPTGPYWWAYWTMITCNVLVAAALLVQALPHEHPGDVRRLDPHQHRHVVRALRHHRDVAAPRLPARRRGATSARRIIDIGTFTGTLGLFFTLFLLFIRWLPMVAMTEVKGALPQADPHSSATRGAPRRQEARRAARAASLRRERSDGDPAAVPSTVGRVPSLILAEFDTAHDVLHAAEKVRDAGYAELGHAHAVPGPRHGPGDGPRRLALGWIVSSARSPA